MANWDNIASNALEQGKGIVRLTPTWVPRSFCIPGRRIKLHPDDYLALGGNRGGIDERWFASTTAADNGPLTAPDEGLSHIVFEHNGQIEKVTLLHAVSALKDKLIGELWEKYKGWPMYSKFFDNQGPLPFHIHQRDEHVKVLGKLGKPEAYYFPPQVNNHGGDRPSTYFGFRAGVTKEQVKECLANFEKGDNKLTDLSVEYKLRPGTGWDVPAGVLHAPGSLCTYEPQRASDVFAMYESYVENRQVVPRELLWKDTPPNKVGNIDYLLEVIDWEANTNPNFAADRFMAPVQIQKSDKEIEELGYVERWVCYKSPYFSAKELTVLPGRTVIVKDGGAYGFIMTQGHGKMGEWDIETPALIRYGQLTNDEFFVSEQAAREGIKIVNPSKTDPIVMLKHFGPGVLPKEFYEPKKVEGSGLRG